MPGETSFAKIKFAQAADETKAFPAEVSEAGAKTIDKYLEERTLTLKTRAASYEAKSGEWGECSKALTVTLPLAATANQYIGVINGATGAEVVKVTASGGAVLNGDFVSGKATIELMLLQHVTLQSDGTNWAIMSGEPKRTEAYTAIKSFTKAEAETGVEPSATRPALVTISIGSVETPSQIEVGGVVVAQKPGGGAFAAGIAVTIETVPGEKWKANGKVEAATRLR